MSGVVAWVTDRTARERLRAAMRDESQLHFVEVPSDVLPRLLDGWARLVVIQPSAREARAALALVEALRVGFPSVAIVAYCQPRPEMPPVMLDLARAGVSDLVLAGIDDDRHRLAALLSGPPRRAVVDDVMADVAALALPPTAQRLVHTFLEAADRPLAVDAVASAIGIHRRTLFARTGSVGLPNPRDLAAWCRLLTAARQLDDEGVTVERVAANLDFPSANALRNLLRRHAGLSPSTLRTAGGYAELRRRFVALLAEASGGRTASPGEHRSTT